MNKISYFLIALSLTSMAFGQLGTSFFKKKVFEREIKSRFSSVKGFSVTLLKKGSSTLLPTVDFE